MLYEIIFYTLMVVTFGVYFWLLIDFVKWYGELLKQAFKEAERK